VASDALPATTHGGQAVVATGRGWTSSARLLRLPAVWLFALVSVSTVVRAGLTAWVPGPWILPDELLYSELAKSIADGSRPAIRSVPVFGWGEVYPTLIAPAWVIFDDPVWAYHAALAINALVMSLVAVPAYLLARLFVATKLAFVVAAMAVLVPSMTYTGVLMTENAFYPAFVLALFLVARSVRRPTLGAQALALFGLGLLAFTRLQGLALAGAYAGAVVVHAVTGPRAERVRYLRRFLPSVGLGLVACVVPVAVSTARRDGPLGWLGARSGTFDVVRPGEIPKWFAYLAADLLLYVAVVPIVAAAVVVGLGLARRAAEEQRLFASVALPTALAMLGSVSLVSATFDVDGGESVNERYVFALVPLLFVGLALWIQSGLPRPRPWALAILVTACVLPVIVPVDHFEYTAEFQSLALLPWQSIPASRLALAACVAVFTAACGLVWATLRRESTGRAWMLAGAAMIVVGAIASLAHAERATNSATPVSVGRVTWVDDAVPAGARVAVLWDERSAGGRWLDPFYPWVMVTELFNTSLGEVYRLGPPTYYEGWLPTVPVRERADGSLALAPGSRATVDYVLTTCRTSIDGTVVARSLNGSLVLSRVDGALRIAPGPTCRKNVPWVP
jgi:hypothetical protein